MDLIATALEQIEAGAALKTVTRVLPDRPIGRSGPLAGIPFVAKDLFDVAGLPTTAGAQIRADIAPAMHDAQLIAWLEAAGATLVGTTNMDAFAYGFSTENAWTGTCRNPHDPARLAGGSSGGSAAAVAAGFVPLAIGSDTNGSVRVPASLCGIYGLKPTHGALAHAGMFPFAASFDDPGPFTASLELLRRFWAVATGAPVKRITRPLTAARLIGWFADGLPDEIQTAVGGLCAAIGASSINWAEAEAARSGAFLITAAEGGALHKQTLAEKAGGYDPGVRDRLLAGTFVPEADIADARALMAHMRADLDAIFAGHDILITPATPATAPLIEQPTIPIGGVGYPARSHLGILTQPITFLGVPALSVPLRRPGQLPLGAQLIARPGREADLFAFAAMLEAKGLTGVTPPGAAA